MGVEGSGSDYRVAYEQRIIIDPLSQRLSLFGPDGIGIKSYVISTAANGLGETIHSEKTPRGLHKIRAKIGEGTPIYTVFKGRRPTGDIYSTGLESRYPKRDWILSRILWLSGIERHFNRLGSVDSLRRYIYIHGFPDHHVKGVPESHGCIRMKNHDIIELFDLVNVGTIIEIFDPKIISQ